MNSVGNNLISYKEIVDSINHQLFFNDLVVKINMMTTEVLKDLYAVSKNFTGNSYSINDESHEIAKIVIKSALKLKIALNKIDEAEKLIENGKKHEARLILQKYENHSDVGDLATELLEKIS